MRVLLVEDNLTQAMTMRLFIQAMPGWEVTHAPTLSDAKAAVRAEGADAFGVAVVDLTLPDAHNLEAVIFAQQAMPDAICVVVSGEDQVSTATAALRYGASDYLVKTTMNMDAATLQRALQLAVTRRDLALQLRQSEENLRALLTGLVDAIFVIDDNDHVLFRNPFAENLRVGFHAPGAPEETLVQARPEIVEQMIVRDHRGNDVPVEVRTRPLRWAGAPARLVVLRDMGPERRAQAAEAHVRRIEALAAAGDESLNDWHDVGNKLQGLDGGIAQLHRRVCGLPPDESDDPDPVRSAQDAIQEIKQIALKYKKAGVQLRNVREMIHLHALVEGKCLAFRSSLEHETLRMLLQPTPAVLGDPVELAGVVENLLVNALKAIRRVPGRASPGTIVVSTFVEGDRVCVRITDDGPGFQASHSRFWEKGVTGDASGLGRGLTRVREIVHKHHGDVGILSTEGQGAIVTFRIPVAQTTPLRKRRVLLIEDDQYAGPAARRMLGRSYDVALCEDGQDALDALEQDDGYDVIICDLEMPRVDGVTFYRRALERWPHLTGRVAFCSGGALNAEVAAFLRQGIVPMLPKPMCEADAIALIEALAATPGGAVPVGAT